MVRRIFLFVLCVSICACLNVKALEPRRNATLPTLNYSGSTAVCELNIMELGKQLDITMELWQGTTLIDSWTKSGMHSVVFEETCDVISGQTYTLKVYGTADGESITNVAVTRRCP